MDAYVNLDRVPSEFYYCDGPPPCDVYIFMDTQKKGVCLSCGIAGTRVDSDD